MSIFRTKLPDFKAKTLISHQDTIMSVGSCFAENIGNKLKSYKFKTTLNPFGILYNPVSIAQALSQIMNPKPYQENDIFQHMGLWHSFHHHGHFSKSTATETLASINTSLQQANQSINQTNQLIITLGTAYVFEHKKTKSIVANCHKLPNSDFDRKRLTVQEISAALSHVFEQLKNSNPNLNILLTLSPIRHIRDGLHENQVSKATLLLAIEEFCTSYDYVNYFPAYELLLDDLRDYRFYESDMIHPNQLAIDYIWEYFSEGHFSAETIQLNQQIEQLIKASQHRPFHPESEQHLKFKEQQLVKIKNLEKQHPHLDFGKEKESFI